MITSDQFRRLQKQSKRKLDKLESSRSGNKLGAKGQYYNGSYYHSHGEAEYAQQLDFRLKGGDITDWKRQVKISLDVNGHHVTNYFMDFIVTHNDGSTELIEYKGFETRHWEIKWALLHALKDQLYPNGVTITLVKHKSKYNPWQKRKKQGPSK